MSELKEVVSAVTYNPGIDNFLLLRRVDERSFPGCWEFPSGGLEEDESHREGALRELREETGLAGEVIRTGDRFEVKSQYGEFLVHPFLVMVDSAEVEISEEHSKYRWVEPDDIKNMETVKDLRKDLVSVGALDE